jgi:hypothetical protein
MTIHSKIIISIILLTSILLGSLDGFAQQFQRIKAEYSIKYKDPGGNEVLQMGMVFYDINSKKIVMKNGFPVREILVQSDTSIIQIRNDRKVASQKTYAMVELSIYHLALTGNLNNYGLDKAGYKLDTVKSDKGLILSTWSPPENAKDVLGRILVSTKEKQLFGIVFLDPREKIIAKHFYRDYTTINGFEFPSEVLIITYNNDKEIFHLSKFSKIVVNETGNEEFYNYKIPLN